MLAVEMIRVTGVLTFKLRHARRCDSLWLVYSHLGDKTFGRQTFGRQFFPNVHLGHTKLDVWATMTSRLGDKSKSQHLGQPQSLGRSRHH